MIRFQMEAAGCAVDVQAQYESTKNYCRQYLTDKPPQFAVKIEPEDLAFERHKSIREDTLEGLAPRNYSEEYLETIALQRKIAQELFARDTLLFHGSVIAVDGAAYLFTAKSGTGKSTHTRLWRQMLGRRAVMVNDDKPFLRITPEGVLACGSPWNGKHGLGSNLSVPLKAICILERGEQNRICPMQPRQAVFMLLQQSSRPADRNLLPKYMELLDRLAGSVRFYRLACNMNPEAAQVAYEAMAQGEKGE